jgi:electron transport complex protein RnfG
MILVLTSVALLSGALLTGVNLVTRERIELNRQKEIKEAINEVVPGTLSSQVIHDKDALTIYRGKNKNGEITGYAIYSSGTGFQDKITIMLGTDPSLSKTNGLVILEQTETPGLGAKITDEKLFLRFWENKDISQQLSLNETAVKSPDKLSPSEVNTITGATISSEAVLNIANNSIKQARVLLRIKKNKSRENNGN